MVFDFDLQLNNDKIERVRNMRYLGVQIDETLSFKEHFQMVTNKLRKKVSVLRRLRFCLPQKTKLLLFKSLVKPHTKYCQTLFLFANGHDMNEIQVTLNNGLRAVLNIPYNKIAENSVASLHSRLDLLFFTDDVFLETMTFIHKIKLKLFPDYLSKFLIKTAEIHDYSTRQINSFYISNKNLSISTKSIFYQGVSKYNKLNSTITNCPSVPGFRRLLVDEIKKSGEYNR